MATNREKCIKMWEWIAAQTPCPSKIDYFTAKNIGQKDIPESFCYACKESNDSMPGDEEGCNYCPLGYDGETHCQDDNTPFSLWEEEKTKESAATFLEFIKETWKE